MLENAETDLTIWIKKMKEIIDSKQEKEENKDDDIEERLKTRGFSDK